MTTYITLLRGVNVGGKTVKMDALRKMCLELGLKDVRTYIQSGNIVYSFKKIPIPKLNEQLREAIARTFALDVPLITLTAEDLEEVISHNPMSVDKKKDPSFLHVTFLAEEPDAGKVRAIQDADYKGDSFTCRKKALYLYCPGGYGKTKLNNSFFESKLKVGATTRNWRTTNELLNMARE